MAGTQYVYTSNSAPGLAVTQLLPSLVPGGVRLPPTPIAMCHGNVKSLSVGVNADSQDAVAPYPRAVSMRDC